MEIKHDLYLGDCEQILKQIPGDSKDLVRWGSGLAVMIVLSGQRSRMDVATTK